MKRLFQMIGVLIVLLISVYVRRVFKQLAMDNYNLNYTFIGIVINLMLYQLCYWLIEKLDKLILLRKKWVYLLGIFIIMFMTDGLLAIVFYRYLWLTGMFPIELLDSTFLAILIFIFSTLIGNNLLNRITVDK